jgi:DNA-binding transcriptional MerR regulator/methylmalonyl-CoA mutase cobalamin-binding subunit
MTNEPDIGIAAVERETGLSKDTLRVWERRYGFPKPSRDANGERAYPSEQVHLLRRIRRLMDRGARPGRIFAMGVDALEAKARDEALAPAPDGQPAEIELLRRHRIAELRAALEQTALRGGLYEFVTGVAAPLTAQVGEAWARGELQVYEEHLFSEQLQAVLRGAIARLDGAGAVPRVLLSTLPGEQHGLGLLMAQAVFALEGAACVSLGTQTPVREIADAVRAEGAHIVALSASSGYPAGQLKDGVAMLRAALPAGVELWCGGAGSLRLRQPAPGVRFLGELADIRESLARWREAHAAKQAITGTSRP